MFVLVVGNGRCKVLEQFLSCFSDFFPKGSCAFCHVVFRSLFSTRKRVGVCSGLSIATATDRSIFMDYYRDSDYFVPCERDKRLSLGIVYG